MLTEQKHKSYGTDGEELAVQFLLQNEYHILDKNFRCKKGEIDIIAQSDGYLCFIEVKRRKSLSAGHPLEAINTQKIKRICSTALHYLRYRNLPDLTPIRFDVVSIIGEDVTLIKNAFSFIC